MYRYLLILMSVIVLLQLPGVSTAEPGVLKWKYPLSNQLGPDAAVTLGHDGTIYVPDGNSLLALDPGGNLKWVFTGSSDDQLGRLSVGTDGTIYVTQFANGYRPSGNGMYALDASGNLLWTFDPPGFAIHSAMLGAVAIGSDGNIYVTGLQESDNTTHLFSITASGVQKWASPSDGGLSIPAIDSYGRLYSMGVYRLYGVSPSDGSTVVVGSTEIGGHWRAPSLGVNGIVYVVGSSRLQAYDADGVMLWEYMHRGNFAEQPGEAVMGVDGKLYLSTFDYYQLTGYLHALMPDGSTAWVHEFPYREKPVGSPAIGSDGSIYVASEATAIPSSPQETGIMAFSASGSLLWSMPDIQPRWSFYNSPIVGADGTLYILGYDSTDPNNTYVYAIQTACGGPALSAWPMVGANAQHTNVANNTEPPPSQFVPPVQGGISHNTCPYGGTRYSMVWSGMYGGPDSDRCEGTGGHPGVDITQATADEKIYSIGKGTVVLENNKIAKGWGKYVVIRHDNVSYHDCTDCPKSVYSIYTHLKSIDEALPPPGEIIGSNQVVGIMGATGITGGIHLHLQVQPAWNKKPYWPTYTNSIGKPMAYPLTNNCGRKKNQWCDLFLSEEQRQEAAENVRKNTISPIWFIENGSYRE